MKKPPKFKKGDTVGGIRITKEPQYGVTWFDNEDLVDKVTSDTKSPGDATWRYAGECLSCGSKVVMRQSHLEARVRKKVRACIKCNRKIRDHRNRRPDRSQEGLDLINAVTKAWR